MHTLINSPLRIGSLNLPHRLIQGPLAGYSCAPFRVLFQHFTPPAYCVSEMCSAQDVLFKHTMNSRYLYRDPQEKILAYQLSGNDPALLAQAAIRLEHHGADLIDLNCGCPKTKIRKKGAGSALLNHPEHLARIVQAMRSVLSIPLTVKIRIQDEKKDIELAQQIEEAGADALIVHGRTWHEDYDTPCHLQPIAEIKKAIRIPVIANGDIHHHNSLYEMIQHTQCDGYMISRAGTGRPWLFKTLLEHTQTEMTSREKVNLFMAHLEGLSILENEYQAILQSKSLVRYYFKNELIDNQLQEYYRLQTLNDIKLFLNHTLTAQ